MTDNEARAVLAEKRLHDLYECRFEGDKLIVMLERYEQEAKRRMTLPPHTGGK